MERTIQHSARALHEAYQDGRHFPADLRGELTLDQAYEVQFALLDLRRQAGEVLAGWKVGLTSPAMQRQQGVFEPCLGHLLKSGAVSSGAALAHEALIHPGFENELCLRIGRRLWGPGVTADMAASHVEAVAPALEIVEKRSDFGGDFPLAIAGNAQQRAFVTGAFVPFDLSSDLARVEVTVTVNGREMERARGAEVLGHPLNAVAWLAGALANRGLALEPGDLVMSGSFTRQYPIARGDRVCSVFSGIGAVDAGFP